MCLNRHQSTQTHYVTALLSRDKLRSLVMSCVATGPGNGLLLYLNIEQYEYTKDPGRGVGIKVRRDQSVVTSHDTLGALMCLEWTILRG